MKGCGWKGVWVRRLCVGGGGGGGGGVECVWRID